MLKQRMSFFCKVIVMLSIIMLSGMCLSCSKYDSVRIKAPTGLYGSISGTYVTLYWNSVSNAYGYNVYCSESNSGPWSLVLKETHETSAKLVVYSETAYFVVTAVDGNDNESSFSSPFFYTRQGGDNNGDSSSSLPSAPTGLTGSRQGTTSYPYIYLNWNYSSSADSYVIYRSSSAYGTYSQIGTSTTNSYSDSNFKSGNNYYKVAAKNSAGIGPMSNYCLVSSDNGTTSLPSAPTGLTGSRQGPALYSYVYLSWNYSSGVDSYVIYRSTSANGTYSQIGTSTSNSYSDENFKSGNNYYKVAAKNSAGIGPKSDYCLVSINNNSYKPDFSSLKGSASGNKLTFTWSAKTGTGYGTPDKVTIQYYYNLTSTKQELRTETFTGSKASSGSYSFSNYKYLMDEYGKVSVRFTISNSNGENSRTVTYYNGSFYGTM